MSNTPPVDWFQQAAAAAGYGPAPAAAPMPAPPVPLPPSMQAPPPPADDAWRALLPPGATPATPPPSTPLPPDPNLDAALASLASPAQKAPPSLFDSAQPPAQAAPPPKPETSAGPPAPPAPPPAALPAGPPPPPTSQAPVDSAGDPTMQFRRVGGGGVTPAREVPTRGPIATAALNAGLDAQKDAVNSVDLRTQLQAEREELVRDKEAEDFVKQQERITQVAQQRQAMMERMRIDFDEQAQKLGEMQINHDRYWGSMSTPEKIGTLFLVFLAGGGGPQNNAVLHALNDRINADVDAQKFSYQAGLDQLKSKQTAFSMAMHQFQEEDAAEAQARASGLAAAQAKLGAMAAQWKGTEAANRADQLRGAIEDERMKTLANGFKFMPPQLLEARYKMMFRGMEMPGTFSQKEAQAAALEHGVKPAENVDQKLVELGGQAAIKRIENEGKAQERKDKNAQFVAEKELHEKLPERQVLTDAARRAQVATPLTGWERLLQSAGITMDKRPALYQALTSEKQAEREQAITAWENVTMHGIGGATMPEPEKERLRAGIRGANTQESRLKALAEADAAIARTKATIRSGVSDSGASFDRNSEGVPERVSSPDKMPSSFTTHGKK